MAAAFESLAVKTYGETVNTTVDKPTGTAEDDVLIAQFFMLHPSSSLTKPSGWELAPGSWPIAVDAGDVDSRQWVYYKIAGASEPSTYTWAHTTNPTGAAIFRFSGVDLDEIFDEVTPSQAQGTGPTRTWTEIQTQTADALLLAVGWDYAATSDDLTPPSGFTERLDGVVQCAATMAQAVAGLTGTPSHTDNGTPWIAALLALRSLAPPAFDVSVLTTGDGPASTSLGGDISGTEVASKQARTSGGVSSSLPESGLWPASIDRELADPGGVLYRCIGLRNDDAVTLSVTWYVKVQFATELEIAIGLAPEDPGDPTEEILNGSTAPVDVVFAAVDSETALGPFVLAPGEWQGLWHELTIPAGASRDDVGEPWTCRFVIVEDA